MSNDDVYRCHACLSIPTRADYGSLNLAGGAADRLRLARALGGFAVEPRTIDATLAPTPPRCRACSNTGSAGCWSIGFLDPAAPKKLMPRLNQLLARGQPGAAGGRHPARHCPLRRQGAGLRASLKPCSSACAKTSNASSSATPAARSRWEVLTCYRACTLVIHRWAHAPEGAQWHWLGSASSHTGAATGIEIHLGATIGRRLHRPRHGHRGRGDPRSTTSAPSTRA